MFIPFSINSINVSARCLITPATYNLVVDTLQHSVTASAYPLSPSSQQNITPWHLTPQHIISPALSTRISQLLTSPSYGFT